MNSEFFSVASTGLGDSRRAIKCQISGATVATYGDAAEEVSAWAAARTIQGNTIASLQNGEFIRKEVAYYNLAELQAAYARSVA